MEKIITDDNFLETIKSARVVLVDFWAPWCGPCRMLGPVIEEIADEYADKVLVGKYNVDEHMAVAGKLGITSIPALFFFKDGETAGMMVGYRDKSEITSALDSLL